MTERRKLNVTTVIEWGIIKTSVSDRAEVPTTQRSGNKFKRAGEVVEQAPQTVNTGYFIVVPAGEGRKKAETWRIDTHMTIRGEARDHAALSRFVRRLVDQPEIQDARVIRTAARTQSGTRVVSFEMAVIVHSGAVTG